MNTYSLKIVTSIGDIDKKKWSAFVYNHEHGNIFQTPEMYAVYENSDKYEPFILIAKENEDISGVLLAVIQKEHKSFLGRFSARSIIWGGPLINDHKEGVLDLLLENYDRIIKKKAIYSQFRNFWVQQDERKVFEGRKYEYLEHLNIYNNLIPDIETLWKGIKKSRREGIRKAKRNNLSFSVVNTKEIIPEFYQLLKTTYSKVRLPSPKLDFFYTLHDEIPHENLKFFSLSKDGKIIIVLAALIYKKCIYAFYIGTDSDQYYLRMRPADLLHWEIMSWAKKNGCERYDWLGAGKPNEDYGVRDFKLQYGGELIELGRYERIYKPVLMELGKLGLKLWQKLK